MKALHIEHDNLASRLLDEAVARGWGDRIALREGARTLTYHQLRDQAARTATALRTLRIERGDRVAILMPDTLEAAVALFGALYHGAVAVPLSELARASDIADLLNDSGATAIVVHASLRSELEEVGSAVPSLREVLAVGGRGPGQRDFVSLVRGAAPAAEPAEVDPDGTAILLYSAGAHGEQEEGGAASRRRGVPHTHATPLRAFESLCRGPLPLGESDRVLSVVRLWTAYGIGAGLLFPLAAGAESLLLPEQPHSRAIFAAVESFKPSALFATPSVYGQLARDAEGRGLERPLASVRVCVSGAEDMPSRVSDKVRQILGAEVTVSYGLTEAFQFVLCGPATLRPGACGKPVPGFDVRVVNDAGEEIGADEIGTLEIRGPTVAAGYWNDNRSTLRQGWFKTRDRFLVDRDGNYYHCGRADDLFKVGGKWVSPSEVEQALIAHEAVWECAVVGADDEDGLIKPLAFVVPNIGHEPGPDLEKELREYVKKELAPYKYPRWIDFLSELPKGPHGKVLRYKLRDRVRSSGRARRAETANT